MPRAYAVTTLILFIEDHDLFNFCSLSEEAQNKIKAHFGNDIEEMVNIGIEILRSM